MDLIVLAWPILVFTVINVCWVAAGISLGRLPVPYKDDPKSINVLVSALYYPAVISMLLSPIGCLISLAALFVGLLNRNPESPGGTARRAGAVALSVVLWIGLFVVLRLNPYGVTDWLMD